MACFCYYYDAADSSVKFPPSFASSCLDSSIFRFLRTRTIQSHSEDVSGGVLVPAPLRGERQRGYRTASQA
eukprot:7899371-Pyramimonas_sp.AAC.1